MKNIFICILFFFFIVIGCDELLFIPRYDYEKDIKLKIEKKNQSVNLLCEIYSLKIIAKNKDKRDSTKKEDYYTLLMSDLTITGIESSKYDLRKVCLSVNNNISCNIHITAPAHIFIKEKTIKKDEICKEKVYWVYDYRIDIDELKDVLLLIK